MKQHITPSQVNELSDKAKKELSDSWYPHGLDLVTENGKAYWLSSYDKGSGYWCVEDNNTRHLSSRERLLPLLSIGQMIELLSDYWPTIDRELNESLCGSEDGCCIVQRWSVNTNMNEVGEHMIKEELCDALWDAVKAMLED